MTRFALVVLAGLLVLTPVWALKLKERAFSADGGVTPNVVYPKLDDAQREKAAKLIEQLGDGDFRSRERASKELPQIGPGVIPLLTETLKTTTDPEVKRRIEEILPNLERTAALAPTKVTVSIKNKTVREAVKELSTQSGYRIELYDNQGLNTAGGRVIDLELKDATFWEAMDKISTAGGIHFRDGWYGSGNATVAMQFGDPFLPVISNSGPFRISVKGFYYNKNVDFSGQTTAQGVFGKSESLSINIGVTVEPKLPIVGVGYPTITEALDDNNESMIFPQQVNRGYYNGYQGYRQYAQQVQTQLQPTKSGKKLSSLKGTIPVTVVSAQKARITVDKLLEVKNKTFKDGATTMAIDEVTKNGNQVVVRMTISETAAGGQPDYTWINSLMQRLEVVDAKGNKFQSYGQNWTNNNGTSVSGTFTWGPMGNAQGVGDPVQLVYYEWVTMPHNVEFEFKDVPLP